MWRNIISSIKSKKSFGFTLWYRLYRYVIYVTIVYKRGVGWAFLFGDHGKKQMYFLFHDT